MAGTGTIGKQLQDWEKTTAPATPAPRPAAAAGRPARPAGPAATYQDGPMLVVPAGFIGDVLGSLSGTIGEITGGYFGNARLGREFGEKAAPLTTLLPFTIIPPSVAPASAGPQAGGGSTETLVVVPSAFLGGLLGGIGGKLLGGLAGDWLGDKGAGEGAGGAIGTFVGGLLPFSVVPPSVAPAAATPEAAAAPQEAMVVVPAGFFGDLLSGWSGTIGDLVAGDTGKSVGDAASPFLKLLPFQTVPPELTPQTAGPGGTTTQDELIVLPAGFLGSMLSGLAGTIGGTVGGWLGDSGTGEAIGNAVAPVLDLLPFHAVPPELAPQANGGPAGAQDPASQLMLVPAGLFGHLLSGLAGTLGGLISDQPIANTVTSVVGTVFDALPFHTIAPQSATS
jgi:hypothetical protein